MLIKPFSTPQNRYIYSAWTNQIARVARSTWEYFHDTGDRGAEDSEVESAARELGLLPTDRPRIETLPAESLRDQLDELERRGPTMIVLGLTEQCNFRCIYCVYSGAYPDSRAHSPTVLPGRALRQAIAWYLSFEREEYRIGFYGGEPLLRFEQIRDAVRDAREQRPSGTRLKFAVTTNGSLLSDEICDFLVYHEFDLHISLDGPREIHDRYRIDVRKRPTFDRVWGHIERLQCRHPEYFESRVGFNITAAPPCQLSEIARFLDDHPEVFGSKVPRISPLSGDAPDVFDQLGVREEDRHVSYADVENSFLDSCLHGESPSGISRACCERTFATLHRRSMKPLGATVASRGQCILGTRCFISTDGQFHMCEHGNEKFPIGSIETGFDRAVITHHLLEFAELIDRHCHDCWAIRFCTKCIPMIARGEELSTDRLHKLCRRNRANLEHALAAYCHARDQNERCFDWMAKDQPAGEDRLQSKEKDHERRNEKSR